MNVEQEIDEAIAFLMSASDAEFEDLSQERYEDFRKAAAWIIVRQIIGLNCDPMQDLLNCMIFGYIIGVRDGTPVPEAFKEE